MMNMNDEDFDVELALGSTNYTIGTRLINSSGAGVNADSRMNPAFAASDPLSELVWSPHNGLRLKCADSSAADGKPFLLWNVGRVDKIPSPSQIIRPKGSRDEHAVDQGNLTMSQPMLDADDIFVDKDTSLKPLESCRTPDLGPYHRDFGATENNRNMEEKAETKDANQNEENCTDDGKEDLNRPQNGQSAGVVEISQENAGLQPQKEPDDKVTSAAGEVNANKLNTTISIPALPLKKGKEKALSGGDICGRASDDEDNSHESVESCNSAALFPRGIKRQSYDKGVILGSRRMKKQIHASPGSTSTTRPDCSFMNWISNMVKGLSDSNKQDSLSCALTLACSNDVYGKNYDNLLCYKTQDSAILNMGFQNKFQSLYSRGMNTLTTGLQKENDSKEEGRELMVDDRESLENSPGERNSGSSCKQIIACNREVNPVGVGQPSNLVENKASEILVSNRAKDGAIPSDFLGEKMNSAAERTSPDNPVVMSDVSRKINRLSSLWITRLSSKNPRPEKCKQITQEIFECSTSCPNVDLDSQMNAVFPIDQKSFETGDTSANSQLCSSVKESQKFTTNTELSVDLKSISKLCCTLPSQNVRSSEAMASVFARRLDALRHIIPSKERNSSTCSLTCFFCGSCHDLRECPNVTKPELEDLLVKTSSFDMVGESSCLCIRCSKSDHWAISCPLAPSSRHWISEQKAPVVSRYTACRLQLYARNEKSTGYQGGGEDHTLVAADQTDCSSRKPLLGSSPTLQTWAVQMSSSERVSTSNEMRASAASNLANDVQDNRKSPPCDIAMARNAVVLSEIFHAIRNLRLSRADILRWMNSNVSLEHLNGFFLRLRLGKLEAGVESISYYVACISGDAKEHKGCMSRKSILVDVGGIKSSVASQYVSNHDFLEDEIRAWWCRIVDNGCRIPSLAELNSKFNDRKTLGF